ncbi:basic helix-loop-helix transcription factor amos [Hydra vulgaris]|uniref:Basic helix-loop-helix transcription factor amos n=1 Tax=Hydra vulgaris TaxID=6087 RepID=A0ABM4D057_HYDVU
MGYNSNDECAPKTVYKIETEEIEIKQEISKEYKKRRKAINREDADSNNRSNENVSPLADTSIKEKKITLNEKNDYQRKRSKLNNILFRLEKRKKTENTHEELRTELKELDEKLHDKSNQNIFKKRKNTNKNSESKEYEQKVSQIQRRLVANARERSRVHALSNAFNLLRTSIPSYSPEQKLSKLTILRVAINYISALEEILNDNPSIQNFAGFVDECTCILQTEYGRSKFLNYQDKYKN